MIIKCLFLLVAVLICQFRFLHGQENKDQKKWETQLTGFIRADFWYDTRVVKGVREDLVLFYPENIVPDATGIDLNDRGNLHALLAFSRLSYKITGTEAFGAKTTGLLEADFTGASNSGLNEFRLRHACVNFDWSKTNLLIGQFWHPMFVTEVYPDVLALNTGSPFQPFIRNPQVTLTYKPAEYLKIIFSALTQRDNASSGPNNPSPEYIRNAAFPNLHVQTQAKFMHHIFGAGFDYKRIQPRTKTDSGYMTNEILSSYALMAYYKYKNEKLTIKTKMIYGQNLSEHLLLGGYAVKDRDPVTAKETYTPHNHLFTWINCSYGQQYIPSFFAGYIKNYGTTGNNTGVYYSLFQTDVNIDHMYRIAPMFSVVENNVKFSAEVEYTVAAFGTPDKNDHGKVKNTSDRVNTRILLSMIYNF